MPECVGMRETEGDRVQKKTDKRLDSSRTHSTLEKGLRGIQLVSIDRVLGGMIGGEKWQKAAFSDVYRPAFSAASALYFA